MSFSFEPHKPYYLDGEITSPKKGVELFGPDASKPHIRPIFPDTELRERITDECFNEVPDFFNRYKHAFSAVKNELNLDLRLLFNYRLYYDYLNLMTRVAGAEKFLADNPTGKIITTDSKLALFFPDSHLLEGNRVQKKKGLIKRLLDEIRYIQKSAKPFPKSEIECLVFLNSSEAKYGRTERFGELHRAFTTIFNRDLFDPKKAVGDFVPRPQGMVSTDDIFYIYLKKFGVFPSIAKIHRALNRFYREMEKGIAASAKDKALLRLIKSYRSSFYIYYLRFLSFDRFFEKNRIKAIVLSDENSPQQRVIQEAAARKGVKVYAFQHGNIHRHHPAYIYGSYADKPLLPDLTFTWGDAFSRILVKEGGYEAKKVITNGRIIPRLSERKKALSLPRERRILLYASQPFQNEVMRKRILSDIIKAVKRLPEYVLLIRPHPRERDSSFFQDLADEIGFRDFFIDGESDLQSHLEVCSAMITAYSTVGTEFLPYYKPLFVLDYAKEDLLGWIAAGVGISIRSEDDLFLNLKNGLPKIDRALYQTFLREYYFINETPPDLAAIARIREMIKA